MPPAPAWKLKPSRMMPEARRNLATNSAMRKRSGLRVICVVPETMRAGSPIEGTSTTQSTLLPWICQGTQGKGTRLSVTTITWSAYIESARAKPSEPQADLPCAPLALPKRSAAGAAITAMSMRTSPSWMACQRPPWERSTPKPRILPREQYSPSGPFMEPSM